MLWHLTRLSLLNLGKAFSALERDDSEDGSPHSSSSNSSSDSSESSEASTEGELSSESEVSEPVQKRKRTTQRSTRRSKKSSKKSSRVLIRPTPPEKYNGVADTQVFHHFLTQSQAYVTDGHMETKRQVAVIANFLEDKAFFMKLFDYCFPVDFCSQQRKKLKRCSIGFTDQRERVNKLWYGLRTDIQKALWKERLNPEEAEWSQVVSAAEIHEIAEAVEVGP